MVIDRRLVLSDRVRFLISLCSLVSCNNYELNSPVLALSINAGGR